MDEPILTLSALLRELCEYGLEYRRCRQETRAFRAAAPDVLKGHALALASVYAEIDDYRVRYEDTVEKAIGPGEWLHEQGRLEQAVLKPFQMEICDITNDAELQELGFCRAVDRLVSTWIAFEQETRDTIFERSGYPLEDQ